MELWVVGGNIRFIAPSSFVTQNYPIFPNHYHLSEYLFRFLANLSSTLPNVLGLVAGG